MVQGPMIFGAVNNAGADSTQLQANPTAGITRTLDVITTAPNSNALTGTSIGSSSSAILGHCTGLNSNGVVGVAAGGTLNSTTRSAGVLGRGAAAQSDGVFGVTEDGTIFSAGVRGEGASANSNGVIGIADVGASAYGVWGLSIDGYAGFFNGKVQVLGPLIKSGGGFRIDHPGDRENRYLSHSFVESPEMLNVYCGNVTTDASGSAVVALPTYFEDLNRDFCYQLTVIGQLAQAMVAEEVRDNQFRISTDRPEVRVSWQVTGIRKDPWADRNRIVVEEDKPEHERGTYLHPEVYGEPETRRVNYMREKGPEGQDFELPPLPEPPSLPDQQS